MRSATLFTFGVDILDEGADVVVARAREAGLTSVSTTAAYHAARDILPHNPVRSIAYQPSGAVYFQPDLDRYPDPVLRPLVAPVAGSRDALAELQAAVDRQGLTSSAWTVILHNTRLAEQRPDLAPETALGDRLLHMLCPAQPAVAAYAGALCEDIAMRRPAAIHLESVTYLPFDHGGHHERAMIPLGPLERRLLGLCFCAACLVAASEAGVDGPEVRRLAAVHLRRALDGMAGVADVEDVRLGVALEPYLASRRDTISRFVDGIRERVTTASPGTEVAVIDVSGYFASLDAAATSTGVASRDGFDLRRLGSMVDRLSITAYFGDIERYRTELEGYVQELGDARRLEVILRPAPPDSAGPAELRERVRIARDVGVEHLAFYHYGMLRLEALDWIRIALA